MKTRLFVCVLAAALLPGAVTAQTATDKTMQLLQLLADQQTGGGPAQVTVGALGTSVPKIPLPNAEIIGAITGTPKGTIGSVVGRNASLYYDASDEQIDNYKNALTAAGWKQQSIFGRGGFQSNDPPEMTIYCRADSPTITTSAGDNPRHLAISVMSGRAASTMCNMESMMRAVSSVVAPLPALVAPAGSKMQASLVPAQLGRTGARITSSADVQTLLDDFATQFASAGWTPGPKSGGNGIASQTFQRTDDKQHTWECALMIYPVSGKPGTYFAFLDPTDLTAQK